MAADSPMGGVLLVDIVRCTSIRRLHIFGSRETFVVAELDGREVARTVIKKYTPTPIWNQQLSIPLGGRVHRGTVVCLRVRDKGHVHADADHGCVTRSLGRIAEMLERHPHSPPQAYELEGTTATPKPMLWARFHWPDTGLADSQRTLLRHSLSLSAPVLESLAAAAHAAPPGPTKTPSLRAMSPPHVEVDVLPPNWERTVDKRGRVVYLNHELRISTLVDPREAIAIESLAPGTAIMRDALTPTGVALFRQLTTPLPPGWEMSVTDKGRVFFINHTTKATTWDDPRDLEDRPADAGPPDPEDSLPSPDYEPLPDGWEQRIHENGRVFYIHHATRTTTWNDPRKKVAKPPEGAVSPRTKVQPDVDPRKAHAFASKVATFRSKLEPVSGETMINVRKDHLFEDAFAEVRHKTPEELRKYFRVSFLGDAALDFGGLSREFFVEIGHKMCDPYYGLFRYAASDNATLEVNPSSELVVGHDHLNYFDFVGRIIGLAIFHGKLMDVFFTRAFYKGVLGVKCTLDDLASYNVEEYQSLKWILENAVDDILFNNFCIPDPEFGEAMAHELKDGGKDIAVTDENKAEYVALRADWHLYKSIAPQLDAMREGISTVFDVNRLSVFEPGELEYLISGIGKIDTRDLERNTDYKEPLNKSDRIVRWFWETVHGFDEKQKADLIQFATGTSRVPLGGFSELMGSNGKQKFTLEVIEGPEDRLPIAHTCFNRVSLYPYSTRERLRIKLGYAILGTDAFGIE